MVCLGFEPWAAYETTATPLFDSLIENFFHWGEDGYKGSSE